MIAAYVSKQKKEATTTKPAPKSTLPKQATEPIQTPFKEIRKIVNIPPKEEHEFIEAKKQEPITKEEKNDSQLSILNSQLNLKDPAQGILWNAILHEPRYRVKWKRK
jgi:hypothetical protein